MDKIWLIVSYVGYDGDMSIISAHKTKESAQLKQMELAETFEYNSMENDEASTLGISHCPFFT